MVATLFLSTSFIEDRPHFSPDGRWLAYYANDSGQVEIYAQSFPGPGGKVMVSHGGGLLPVWSPDGRELFYAWRGRIYSVPGAAGAKSVFGTPRVIFAGRYQTGFDVAPDRQTFVTVRNEQGVLPSDVHVVLNRTQELPRLTSAPACQ